MDQIYRNLNRIEKEQLSLFIKKDEFCQFSKTKQRGTPLDSETTGVVEDIVIKIKNYSLSETLPSSTIGMSKFRTTNLTAVGSSKKKTILVRFNEGSISNDNRARKGEIDYLSRLGSGNLYPSARFLKHHVMDIFQRKYKTRGTVLTSKKISKYLARHHTSVFKLRSNFFKANVGSHFFENWHIKKHFSFNHKIMFKLIWRYFKLKIERFFFKTMGMRTHVWFLSVWQIFITAIPSRHAWEYFETKKIIEYTRRGHRYVIETPEDAKFFIRIMVVMFTFLGGIRLFLDKVSEWMANFRNHWAYVRFIAETVRKCSNFFWFRFFLNYRISLQGKIGGQLRAQKKIFNKGTISIEDKSSTIGFHKCYSNTKFGIFNLSMWLQFKVPSITESFGGHELISTMRILLNRYSIPWLGDRLSHVLTSIDSDEKKSKSYQKGGNKVTKKNNKKLKIKKKYITKHKKNVR